MFIYGKLKIQESLELFRFFSRDFMPADAHLKTSDEISMQKKIVIFDKLLEYLPDYDQNVSALEYKLCHDFPNFLRTTIRMLDLPSLK